jgi:maltose alpha-D-glucosyltransferase/alpha-amylase
VHGDFHLGQALFTGKDYVFIDFEGEPARPLGERRLKRSPLLDAAGLLRSYDYASQVALREHLARGAVAPERKPALEAWARFWSDWTGAAFLRSYLAAMSASGLLPASPEDRTTLLDALLLEKAMYELSYELNTRPDWVPVPVSGLLRLLEKPA